MTRSGPAPSPSPCTRRGPTRSQKTGLAYPAEGVIDALIAALPAGQEERRAGTLAGTPLGALACQEQRRMRRAPRA